MKKIFYLTNFKNSKNVNLALKILASKGHHFYIKENSEDTITLKGLNNISFINTEKIEENENECLIFLNDSSLFNTNSTTKITNFTNLYHKSIYVLFIDDYAKDNIENTIKKYNFKFQKILNKDSLSYGCFSKDFPQNNIESIDIDNFFQTSVDVILIKESEYLFIQQICKSFLPFVNAKEKKNMLTKLFTYHDFDKNSFNLEKIFSNKYIYIKENLNIFELEEDLNTNDYLKILEDLLLHFDPESQN